MSNSTIRRVVILGAVAIIGIITVQSYWVLQDLDVEERKFHQSATIALSNVAYNLAALNGTLLPPHNVVNKISSNYYVVNINDTIDAGELEYFLQKELESVALNLDFEYGIYDCASQEMVYGNYCNYSPDKGNVIRSDLPKYDEFIYYFGVKFPTRSGYLAGEMKLSLIFSFLLFLAVLFFLYSMVVILRQKRLSEMQKDFINNMTHEFKTPISTIKISADVFLEHKELQKNPRLYRYAGIIKEQNERLNDQVEKVLQLAKIERNGLKLKKEKIDLNHLIRDVMSGIGLKIRDRGAQLNLALNAMSPVIEADKLHLTNILHNLLDNAIKYCDKDPELSVSTYEVEDQLYLSIADNGIGIEKEHRKKIFNKFYRVPTGNVHNVKGFGLGLFYIKRICNAHGWTISMDSEPGKGTVFTIAIKKSKSLHSFWSFLTTRKLKLNPNTRS